MLDFEVFWEFFTQQLVKFQQGEHTQSDTELTIPLGLSSASPQVMLTIDKNKLAKTYCKITQWAEDCLELCGPKNFEVAVRIIYPKHYLKHLPIPKIIDKENRVTYSISHASYAYCLFLLQKLAYGNKGYGTLYLYTHISNCIQHIVDNGKTEINLEKFLPQVLDVLSLKITTKRNTEPATFHNLESAYSFHFIYSTDYALQAIMDINSLFDLDWEFIQSVPKTLPPPSQSKYNADAVNFYKTAMMATDPFIAYLSYYHVAEYYFDEVFKQRLVTDLKHKLTQPGFSYEDDDQVYSLATFIKQRVKVDAQEIQGNELEALTYVLQKFVQADACNSRILELDKTAANHYKETKVTFSGGPAVDWNDSKGFHKTLAKRIYFTRNALVHSKSGKKHQMYKPADHSQALKREIPLIRAVAEAVIIGSSQLMD